LVDEKTRKNFNGLRMLQNKVSYAPNFYLSDQEAITFIELAIRLREKFDAVIA
jgi:hypothetical protein